MRTTILTLAFAIGLPAAGAEQEVSAEAKDLKLLAGTWSVEAFSTEGEDIPKKYLKGVTLTVKGDRYVLDRADGTKPTELKITLDPAKKPKQVNLTRPGDDSPARVGIYELKGDTVRVAICGVKRKAGRPKTFKPDLSVNVVTFKRMKDKK
jgi:uncharacterized protein (TIGR03067 family)